MARLDSFLLRKLCFHIILMFLFEDSKAEQRPVRDKSRERGKQRAAVALLISISQGSTLSCTAGEGGLSPVCYSLCQGRIGRCQAKQFTLASSHWGLTRFLPESPEHSRVRVLSKGLTPPLPCWLYCIAFCCSNRNAELLSEKLSQGSTAWAIIPCSHAPYKILGKSHYAFGFILYCDYLHLLSLPKIWSSSKQTWPLWLLLPQSMHSTKLAMHKTPPKVCSLDQSCNNNPADYLCLFLGRSLSSSRWSLHHITVILLQVRFWKSCY